MIGEEATEVIKVAIRFQEGINMNSELLVNQYNNRPKKEAALKSFSVKNYRNLNIDKIRFNHDVNLFIGPNNSGKSNLIDAISFSSQIINSNKRESESAFLDELNKRNWGDNQQNFYITDEKDYQLYEMSDGTIKAMIMALLIWSPEPVTILAIDEPEINIHPAWLKVITNWLLRAPATSQWLISTHSPDFLDSFTGAFIDGDVGVFVFAADQKQQVTTLTPNMLQLRLDEGWELGDLYRVGDPLLGGWPW